MSTTTREVRSKGASPEAPVPMADLKLEVAVIPVSDVDRAAAFYRKLGWREDADFSAGTTRVLQFTPPGSACSVIFGKGVSRTQPGGTTDRMVLAVSDLEAARQQLLARGIQVSEAFHYKQLPFTDGVDKARESGRDPQGRSYFSFASFEDPDGNTWLLQEITSRLAGRISSDATSYGSASDLAQAMRRAEAAHGAYEAQLGKRDENWPDWYAEFMVRELHGAPLPQ